MSDNDPEQELVAATLASAPPPDVSRSFLARVNARIDAEREAGWLGLADFRSWTLRLAPAAAAMALLAGLWSGGDADSSLSTASSFSSASAAPAQTFTPSSADDWQEDVSGNAMIEAALTGGIRVR